MKKLLVALILLTSAIACGPGSGGQTYSCTSTWYCDGYQPCNAAYGATQVNNTVGDVNTCNNDNTQFVAAFTIIYYQGTTITGYKINTSTSACTCGYN
jgi:hypothetical protein